MMASTTPQPNASDRGHASDCDGVASAPIATRSESGLQRAEELARREHLGGSKIPSAALRRLYCEYNFYRNGSWLGAGPEPVDDEPDNDFDVDDSVFLDGMYA